ncbi:MAG: heavy-metal-associated domain-containing protein [Deltaproteobacteria bacterium]|nr:MAG: heavy-metal-associated domain-containing protein [Deltaproteobacteria bacterium]
MIARKRLAPAGLLLGLFALLLVALPLGCPEPARAGGAATKEVTLAVEGMTCSSCAVTVKMALRRLDGVEEAKVSFDEKKAVVRYDPTKVRPADLTAAIDKLGYKAKVVGAEKAAGGDDDA